MKDQRIYCRDILERIERIERYTAEGREAFMSSDLLQDGVTRCFEVIGEAVKRLHPTITEAHSEITWSDFAGFRDVLIHQYGSVRYDLVWEFIQEDLPPLKETTAAILLKLDETAND